MMGIGRNWKIKFPVCRAVCVVDEAAGLRIGDREAMGERRSCEQRAAGLRAVSAPISGCVVRAVSAVRKWSQGAGERRLCIKGWRVRRD